MKYITQVIIQTAQPVDLEELKTYLQAATILDLDTEGQGNIGVENLEINWDSLKPAK
jgi:hypothetical protein